MCIRGLRGRKLFDGLVYLLLPEFLVGVFYAAPAELLFVEGFLLAGLDLGEAFLWSDKPVEEGVGGFVGVGEVVLVLGELRAGFGVSGIGDVEMDLEVGVGVAVVEFWRHFFKGGELAVGEGELFESTLFKQIAEEGEGFVYVVCSFWDDGLVDVGDGEVGDVCFFGGGEGGDSVFEIFGGVGFDEAVHPDALQDHGYFSVE